MTRSQKGFTLVELLIVIAIIGLLATLAIVSLTSAQQKARDTKRVADVKAIQTALELYWNDLANYPNPADGSAWSVLGDSLSPYVSGIPAPPGNPVGEVYGYIVNPTNTDQYYVYATIEATNHQALTQDVDGNVAAVGWKQTTTGAVTASLAAVFSCADPVYCLSGDATN